MSYLFKLNYVLTVKKKIEILTKTVPSMNLNDLTVYQLYKSQINGLNKKIPNNLELSNFAKDQSIVKMYF